MYIDSTRAAGQWAAAQTATSPTEQRVPQPEMIQAVSAVNSASMFGKNYELTFDMDRSSRRPLLKLIDRDTHEVVRQIPPEYVLRLARQLKKSG